MVKNRKAKKRSHKPTKHPRPSTPPPKENNLIGINTLPPEAFLEVLYRLSLKDLQRCRCLSKSWVALIDHPAFIQKHLEFNSSRNTQLICSTAHDNDRRKLVAFLSANGPPIPVLDIDIHFTNRPNYPRQINFFDFSKKMVLAGSINGIVCLSHRQEMFGRFVALWNPAIRCWKPIPLPETRSWEDVSVGLGFDVVTNDFKIICIVPLIQPGNLGWSRLEIYSANRDSWDAVDGQEFIPFFPALHLLHCKFIVKGVPYWVGIDAKARNLKVLGGINPCTGLYKKVIFPEYVRNDSTSAHIVNLRDSVTAVILSPGEHSNKLVDLYVLDENTAEWTRMYSIGPLEFETLRAPQCLSTGEIVIVPWTGNIHQALHKVYKFCDPETSRVFCNEENQELDPYWHESYTYVESLVCLKGMVQIGKERRNKKADPKMNNWYLPSRALLLLRLNCFSRLL